MKTKAVFKKIIKNSEKKTVCVMFHNGCPEPERDFDDCSENYQGVIMIKVNTLNSEDIKQKYADGSSKPYYKAYRDGKFLDEIRHDQWIRNKRLV